MLASYLSCVLAAEPINGLGWIFMHFSVGFVVILTAWCFTKVLGSPKDEAEPPGGFGP